MSGSKIRSNGLEPPQPRHHYIPAASTVTLVGARRETAGWGGKALSIRRFAADSYEICGLANTRNQDAPIVAVILVFAVLAILFGVGAIFGYAILGPLSKADRHAKAQMRFYTCDFFTLSFLLALPLLFVAAARRWHGENSMIVNTCGFILIGVFAYAWGRGATALTAVGVVNTLKRCSFLGLVLPIAIVGSAVAIPMLGMMVFAIPQMTLLEMCLWSSGVFVAVVVAILCRKCTTWVLSPCRESAGDKDQIIE